MRQALPQAGLAIIALLLCAMLYRTVTASAPPLPAVGRPKAIALSLPQPRSYMPPPPSSYAEMSQRPLFTPTRRPPPAKPAQAGAASAQTSPALTLIGVVIAKDVHFAIIREANGATRNVEVGDQIENWQVSELAADHVSLVIGDRTTRYELQQSAGVSGSIEPSP